MEELLQHIYLSWLIEICPKSKDIRYLFSVKLMWDTAQKDLRGQLCLYLLGFFCYGVAVSHM